MDEIFKEIMKMWEQNPTAPNAADPTKNIQMKIQGKIQQQVGKTPGKIQDINPKAVVNKAVVDAAQEDPLNVQDALNKNAPNQKMMKKKMKKEHHLLTFEEFCKRQK